jgi:hypothetical protein
MPDALLTLSIAKPVNVFCSLLADATRSPICTVLLLELAVIEPKRDDRIRACSTTAQLPGSLKSQVEEQPRTYQLRGAKSGKLAPFDTQNAKRPFWNFAENQNLEQRKITSPPGK